MKLKRVMFGMLLGALLSLSLFGSSDAWYGTRDEVDDDQYADTWDFDMDKPIFSDEINSRNLRMVPSRRRLNCESRREGFLKYCLMAAKASYGCSRKCKRDEKIPSIQKYGYHNCNEICNRKKGKCYMDANTMQC
jgi:hypothetical protein